jgi:uncharacterized repeat protein (TIGR01451 family)
MRTHLALLAFWPSVLACLLFSTVAFGATLPSQPNLAFQTSGRERVPGIGDWYTTATSGSTDRLHRFIVEVSQQLLDANGGSVTITVNDAESNGAGGDEVFNTPDPTRFELRAPNGTTVLQSTTVPSGSLNGTVVTFTVNTPGSYQVTSVTGAFPISGDATVGLNDDDNSYTISIPGTSTLLGQYQSTTVHFAATAQSFTFYFLVGPGDPNLALRNFDMDSSGTLSYVRPSGATIAGTVSGNGVWNGASPTLNTGQDNVTVNTTTGTRPDVGVWQIQVNNISSNNQWILEANAGANRITLLDQPPTADAGNFRITPDSTLSTTIGTPVDHPFSVTNFFFTNDIINLTTANTAANYTVQLLDSGGTPLTDSDGNGQVDTGVLTPNQTRNFILRVTPTAGAGATDTTRVNAVSLMDTRVVPGTTTTLFVNKTTNLSSSATVSGTVYADADHNGNLGNAETGTGVAGLFVKLVPNGAGAATVAAAVDAATGAYQFTNVAAGSYTLVLDNNNTLSDITPSIPAGYIGTEAGSGSREIVVPANTNVPNQNFGLFNGSRLTGRVFADTGTGGGTANNGVLDGGESGIGGAQVQLTNAAGNTVFDTATTDPTGNYTLWIPASVGASGLRVVETNPANYLSTGGTVGNTGGTYTRTTDATAFTNSVGATYTNVNFGDVPINILTNDGTQIGVPGDIVSYPHVFTAGSAGSVTFSTTNIAAPANTLWRNVLYLDSNGNGIADTGEPIITGPIAVTAGQQINLVVKEFVPANAPRDARDVITLTAQFTYTNANPALSSTLTRTDTTTVSSETGLVLTKTVDKVTAKSNDLITYTITYRNAGGEGISNLIINDTTPAFTRFVSQTNGALPASLTGVTATTPAVNASGALKWTFTGTLAPSASGTVTFVVRLQ